MINAQRVDFIAVPTRDKERAVQFYGETLGLEKNPLSTDTWHEFETGNVTLALVSPEEVGLEFAPLPFGSIAIRVPDVAEARAKLEEAGVEFVGEQWDSRRLPRGGLQGPGRERSPSPPPVRAVSRRNPA